MAVDDFLDSEVAIAAGATAALLSPGVRRAVRTGAVYGTAGVLFAGETVVDAVSGAGRGLAQGVSGRTNRSSSSRPRASSGSSQRSRRRTSSSRSGNRNRSRASSGARA